MNNENNKCDYKIRIKKQIKLIRAYSKYHSRNDNEKIEGKTFL